jgi:NTE family protein
MNDTIRKKIGLALSGGGYRAAAYHIGTLRALNRLGILDNIDVISSVSGGSITSSYYALNKDNHDDFEQSFIKKLQKGVLSSSIINLAVVVLLTAVSVWFIGWWMLLPCLLLLFFLGYYLLHFSFWIKKSYSRLFFGKSKLSDFPIKPLIAINSTDVATGTLFTFSQIKMAGYKYEGETKKIIFNHEEFPVADAVMASSCVPFAFSPVRINRKYHNVPFKKGEKKPLLIDGGLYDNQGAHKLSEEYSSYHTQYIIVSDAGVGEMNAKWAFNIPLMLVKTTNIMMRRIKTFQMRNNIYSKHRKNMRYAYLSLEWEANDRPIQGFIDNIIRENIAPELFEYHNLKEKDIVDLKSNDSSISFAASKKIMEHLKQIIKWNELNNFMPTKEEHNIAKAVGTNLTSLKKEQIDALTKHSNWLTEIQIRLYLPYLIAK